MPGTGLISWALDYQVDRARKDVTVTLFGLGRSHAVYRGEGLGCYLDHGGAVADISLPPMERKPALLPEIAGPVDRRAADRRNLPPRSIAPLPKPDKSTPRNTRAIVVVKDGRVIAERYADGVGIDTPLLGFSATKSVMSALAGILVRKGALKLHEPVPIAAWQGPDDPQARDHARSSAAPHRGPRARQLACRRRWLSALEPVNRMKFMEADMAAYAESMPLETTPGAAWNYHDGNTVILAHLIRQAAGGSAEDLMRFARQELFGPLGMRHVALEFDASGNAEGSSQMLASARDWARFGQLYLNDGVAGGKRILPEGWVTYSAALTPGAWVGMGAGFWTNLGDSFGASYRIERGMPARCVLCQGLDRAICGDRSVGEAGDRAVRPFAELAGRRRRRISARAPT